jgi:MFS family permease
MLVPVLCLAQFIDVKGVTVLIVAMPAMLTDLGAGQTMATIVLTSYAAVFGGALVLGARVSDRYGHRCVLVAGVAVFGLAGLLGAVSDSILGVVVARSLQGAAAAFTVPAALRLLSDATPDPKDRARALSAWSSTGAAAGATGFLLGGVLTDTLGWRSIFAIDVLLAVVIIAAIVVLVSRNAADREVALNVVGAALLTSGAMLLVIAATLLQIPERRLPGAAVLLLGGVASVIFYRWNRSSRSPLVPREVMQDHNARWGSWMAFLNTTTTTSVVVILTLFLQIEVGTSTAQTSLALVPFSLTVILGSWAAGRVIRRLDRRAAISAGLMFIAVGNLLLLLALDRPGLVVPVSMAVSGFGIGLSSVAATMLSGTVPQEIQSVSYGLNNTAAQMGSSLGTALLLLLAAAAQPLVRADIAGWVLAAGLALVGSVLAWTRIRSVDAVAN